MKAIWGTIVSVAALVALLSGALFASAQYSSNQANMCDTGRLIRCQQDILRDIQAGSLQSASLQFPINSGPPYSPKQPLSQQQQLAVNTTICRSIRSHLDCLLASTPACYEQGLQTAQNTDLILRGKRYLEQMGCNEPDASWQSTFCYRSPEVRQCEERYGFNSIYGAGAGGGGQTASSSLLLLVNTTTCLAYQALKYCVDSHLRMNCKVHEMDMINEYLIDRAGDLAWRCPPNLTAIAGIGFGASSSSSGGISSHHSNQQQLTADPYRLNNINSAILSPSVSSYNNYDRFDQQRISIPSYVAGQHHSSSGLNLFGSARDQQWERFRNPADEVARYGISRYPGSSGGSGEVFDRLVNEFDSSDCPVKAAPYARECEDTLLDQQRLMANSRDGNELQKRLCCSLFQYRDCISRVVLDRCADSSQAAVEVLMGSKRRDMTLNCRGFNRDVCSGSPAMALLNRPLLLALAVLTSFMTFKRSLLAK